MTFYKIILGLIITIPCFAQKHFVEIDTKGITSEQAGDLTRLVIPFEVDEGYYIQDFAEVVGNVLPTSFSINENSGFEKVEQEIGTQNYDYVTLDRLTYKVIKRRFEIQVILRLYEYTQYPGTLEGELFYQTCNSKKCFFPRTLKFEVALNNL